MARRKGTEFSFRTPGFFGKIAPKEVVREMRRLEKENGRLTSDIVLDSARCEDSPLHEVFEWNDAVAAEKYRRYQANNLIINIQRAKDDDEGEEFVRVFVRAQDDEGAHYIEADSVEVDDAQWIMDNALRDLMNWVNRYDELADRLPGVFQEVKRAIGKAKRERAA